MWLDLFHSLFFLVTAHRVRVVHFNSRLQIIGCGSATVWELIHEWRHPLEDPSPGAVQAERVIMEKCFEIT